MFDNWVRRETNVLAGTYGSPMMHMTLLADGTLPAKPKAFQDSYEAWKVMETLHPRPQRNAWDPMQPALFDEDPSLPPHDPEGDRARFRAMFGLDDACQPEGAAAAQP